MFDYVTYNFRAVVLSSPSELYSYIASK